MDGEYELTEVQQEISDGLRFFLKAFGAKRFQNGVQLEAATTLITLYGIETFKQGVTWAATVGMSRGRALLALQKALPKWGGNGYKRQQSVAWDPPQRIELQVEEPDDAPLCPNIEARRAWEDACNIERAAMPKSAYETYLSGAELADYETDTGKFIVRVSSDEQAQWLASRLSRTLEHSLSGITNRGASVEFVDARRYAEWATPVEKARIK